jgi:serine/threonine protein kinase/class 3 adenylate cyclase
MSNARGEGRHLAAIMFVDMVGYSARMQENEPRAIAAVRSLWELVRPILAEHNGREVDLAGDGMLMEFPGALSAVRCALQIQSALHEKNQTLAHPDQVLTRAAVHLGDIEHKDERIYGDGINIAARLLPLAPAGGIVLSPHVRDQIHNVLEQPIEKLGTKTLKNIKTPLDIWCIAGPDCTAADLAAARAAAQDESADRRWAFGNALLDERTLELSVDGNPVELEKKSLDVLTFLLHHAGEVVTKDEILEAVWPGRVLTETVLTKCISRIREVLKDEDQSQIKTVHGFGYRLAVPVKVETVTAEAPPTFDFKPGDKPPLRPLWSLVERLGTGGHGEAWLARHGKTKETRVFKFALEASALASLKREITLYRVLKDSLGSRNDYVEILDWNLEELPYFIESEHVNQGNLAQWIEKQGFPKLGLDRRLDLIAQIAEALAAAHSVGVLHKDLKPSNVLIDSSPLPTDVGRGRADGAGEGRMCIKLADFGSGGVLDPKKLEEMGITRMGFTRTVLDISGTTSGTPLYLAPEVISGQPFTALADTYALGVMLYQMVIGDLHKPLAPGWEREIEDELIREDIATAADGNPSKRFPDPSILAAALRDLPARRARRESERYAREKSEQEQRAIERFRARRKWMITALTTMATGLVVSAGLAFYAYRAQKEATAVSDFLTKKVLSMGSPYEGRLKDLTIKDLLDRSAAIVDSELGDQPMAAFKVRRALAESYSWLGQLQEARRELELAQISVEKLYYRPDTEFATLELMYWLSAVLGDLGRKNERRALLHEVSRRLEDKWVLKLFAGQEIRLAVRLDIADTFDNPLDAIQEMEDILRILNAANEPDAEQIEGVKWSLINKLQEAGRYIDAEAGQRQLLAEISARLGDRHYWTSWQRLRLGSALMWQGRYGEAESTLIRAAADMEAWLGPDHRQAILAQVHIGRLRIEQGRLDEAERIIREGLRQCEVHGGCGPLAPARFRWELGEAYRLQRRFPDAIVALKESLAEFEKTAEPDSTDILRTRFRIAEAQLGADDFPAAQITLDAVPTGAAQRLYGMSADLARLRRVQGLLALQQRDYDKARQALSEALKIYEFRHGPDYWRTRLAREELARVEARLAAGR